MDPLRPGCRIACVNQAADQEYPSPPHRAERLARPSLLLQRFYVVCERLGSKWAGSRCHDGHASSDQLGQAKCECLQS
eukprot:6205143-Pleurochrysis_carterae.AAC.3